MRLRSRPHLLLLIIPSYSSALTSLAETTSRTRGRNNRGLVPHVRGSCGGGSAAAAAAVARTRIPPSWVANPRDQLECEKKNGIIRGIIRSAASTVGRSTTCLFGSGSGDSGTTSSSLGAEASAVAPPPVVVVGAGADAQKERGAEEEEAAKKKMKFRNFEEMLEKYQDTPVLVSWGSPLCGPCKLIKKELKVVRDNLGEKVFMASVDTEKFPSLGARYKVEGLPTLMLFKHGEPCMRIEGMLEADQITLRVEEHL